MLLRRHMCVALALVLLSGCKPDPAVKNPEIVGRGSQDPATLPPAPTDTPTVSPVAYDGAITGTMFFKGKPPTGTIDTSSFPACSPSGNGKLPVEQISVKNGKLANAFIYLKSGPPEAMASGNVPAQPVVMDQKNCQFLPHVIGVQAGGFVEFRNSDPTLHNIHTFPSDVGNETIDVNEPRTSPTQTKQFLKPELMIPVRCNLHPWMNAFVNVSATPFFAVSDAAGHFEIHGLPPGDYVIAAVQEKLGEKTMRLTVAPHGTTTAEFSFAQ